MPRIILTALDLPLVNAWRRICGALPDVTVHQGSILDVACDAVVSPANSFGFMDGGIDWVYTRHFGVEVQERLQALIRTEHHGELLVGAAALVPTGDPAIPFVIAAPTMRVPMILRDTVNPYLAARAVLLLIAYGSVEHEGARVPVRELVRSVAFPGLGTGVGRVPPSICARQVRAAIEEVAAGGAPFPQSWMEAQARHQLLYDANPRDLQHE